MQIVHIWFLCRKWKKEKDEKLREINIFGLAGPLVSFGELRLSTIIAQSLSRNPEFGKRKPDLSFLFFFPHLFHSKSLTLGALPFIWSIFCFPLSPFIALIFVSLWCVPSSSVSLQGIFKSVSIHLQAPRTPTCCIEDYFSVSRG